MRIHTLLAFALLLPGLAFALTPLPPLEKPHSFWQHNFVESWNGRSLDEHLNVRVNSDNSGNIQNEQMACFNPTNQDNIVAVWRDFRLGYRRVGVAYSMDRGASWTDALMPQMYYDWQSDPVLVVDDNGVFTAMMISYDPTRGDNGLLQVSSIDGGVTWQDSVWAVLSIDEDGTLSNPFEDKEMLAVDTTAGSPYYGTFYCAWAHFFRDHGSYDSTQIWVTYKRPGEDYSVPVSLTVSTSVQWPNVAIGVNGEVYVSWVSWIFDPDSGWRTALLFARSFDGGETFSEPEVARFTGFMSAEIEPNLLIFSHGVMGVDHSGGENHGRLYLVMTDGQQFEDADIFFTYSDDHGVTWADFTMLNDDNTGFQVDQFHPWLSVDAQGRLWVSFYDRRNDQNNVLMDLYFTVSDDGGATWRPNERISDVSCNPGAGALDAGLIGEYNGWCAQNGEAIAVWTDTRLGNQDTWSALVDSVFVIDDAEGRVPATPRSLALAAYPNPTNSEATLRYTLTSSAPAELILYNTLGQQVRAIQLGSRSPGEHSEALDLNGLSTGLYLITLTTATEQAITKLMLLK